MPTLAVLILTKNEEKNIIEVVTNAKNCTDEVLIIDSGSTDATVKLAAETGARIAYRAWDDDFAAQRNFGLTETKAKWVLYLDADERLNEELIASIKKAVEADIRQQYALIRKSVAFGQKFNHGVLKPDKVARLFPRDAVQWMNKVHERPQCSLPVVILPGHIEHYTYESWAQWAEKFNQYTTIWADNAYAGGKRTSFATAYGHAVFGFIQMAVLKLGILDGWLGLALCFNHFSYTLLKYLKLYELQKSKVK
jgi:glycosyltransferase involved in cell wall biosynthesis